MLEEKKKKHRHGTGWGLLRNKGTDGLCFMVNVGYNICVTLQTLFREIFICCSDPFILPFFLSFFLSIFYAGVS